MHWENALQAMAKNCIALQIQGDARYQCAATRFGGKPDVPADFVWPTYKGWTYYEKTPKRRPLAFLLQLNCKDLAPLDKDGLLPDHGVLSFFYELETQCWGFDPRDQGCARVYWFENARDLHAAEFPKDLHEDYCLPMIEVALSSRLSCPSWEDFSEEVDIDEEIDDEFFERKDRIEGDVERFSQVLGWPDVIQNSMFEECALVTQKYCLGTEEGWEKIPEDVKQKAQETARDEWSLLLQLDTIESGDFELMFGDSGHLYFYIRKEDLQARRFDRIWLIGQCC